MKKWNFEDILFTLFVIICAPILILVFGFYGFVKVLCSDEDDERLRD